MRHKVARNSTTIPTMTTTFTPPPNNILLPRVRSSSPCTSTPLTQRNHHDNPITTSSAEETATTIAVSSITNDTDSMFPDSNPFDWSTPLQPTVVDNNDYPCHFTINSSFETLQACPLDLTLKPTGKKRKSSASPRGSRQSNRSLTNTGIFSQPMKTHSFVLTFRLFTVIIHAYCRSPKGDEYLNGYTYPRTREAPFTNQSSPW